MTSKPRATTDPVVTEEPAEGVAAPIPPVAATPDAPTRPKPKAASFGLSEGTREELERTGRATDPFTGEHLENKERLAELRRQAKARGESVPREA